MEAHATSHVHTGWVDAGSAGTHGLRWQVGDVLGCSPELRVLWTQGRLPQPGEASGAEQTRDWSQRRWVRGLGLHNGSEALSLLESQLPQPYAGDGDGHTQSC